MSERTTGQVKTIERSNRAEIYGQLNSGLREIRQAMALFGEGHGHNYEQKRIFTQFNGSNFLFDEHDQHKDVIEMMGWVERWPSDWAYFEFAKMQGDFVWVHFDKISGDVVKIGVVDVELMKADGAHDYNHSDARYKTDYELSEKSKKADLVVAFKKINPFLKAFREGINPL